MARSARVTFSLAALALGISLSASPAHSQNFLDWLGLSQDSSESVFSGTKGSDRQPETIVTYTKSGRKIHKLTHNEKKRIEADVEEGRRIVTGKLASRKLDPANGMYIRSFKDEKKMEVWIRDNNGRFVLFDSYEMFFSGELGPKFKKGDRQAVEGIYPVGRGQLVRESMLGRSFNTGFPNQFDRSHGRTGSALMVHAYKVSAGCYAISKKMYELYELMLRATAGGRIVQFHAFPFRMTEANFATHASGLYKKHRPFWTQLKPAYDYFEKRRELPSVRVAGGRYIVGDSTPEPQVAMRAPVQPPAKAVPPPAPHVEEPAPKADAEPEGPPIAMAKVRIVATPEEAFLRPVFKGVTFSASGMFLPNFKTDYVYTEDGRVTLTREGEPLRDRDGTLMKDDSIMGVPAGQYLHDMMFKTPENEPLSLLKPRPPKP